MHRTALAEVSAESSQECCCRGAHAWIGELLDEPPTASLCLLRQTDSSRSAAADTAMQLSDHVHIVSAVDHPGATGHFWALSK